MATVPRPRIDLSDEDRKAVRAAWASYHKSLREADRSRRQLTAVLRRLSRRYPVAAIARAVGVTPMAVWTKLRPPKTP